MHRICHIITGLNVGGAERHLAALLKRLQNDTEGPGFENEVVSLLDPGPMAHELGRIPVFSLGMSRGLSAPHTWPSAIRNLARLLESRPPDIIQTWMYHADLMAMAARHFATWPGNSPPPLVWGLRNAYVSSGAVRFTTRALISLLARLSRRKSPPAAIVAPSHTAVRIHTELGYAEKRFRVIPSGVDTVRFTPNTGARKRLMEAAGIDTPDALLVGLVSRWDPVKNVPGFLDAIAALPDDTDARCAYLLMGTGLEGANAELARLVARHPRSESITLLGVRNDLPELLPGLDIAVNSSRGESLPMAVLEAMACGVPCVVTDVGDSARAVGNTGRVAPPGDPNALATAMDSLLRLSQSELCALGDAARQRILAEYDLDRSAGQYAALYRSLVGPT